jgi:hypothetical protein
MNKLVNFLRATFSPAVNNLKKIENDLSNLKKEMEEISKMENKVKAIIRLFQVISPLQDNGGFSQTIFKLQGKNYGQLDQIISALEVLQKHFKNAGRDRFGINRTQTGEEVTAAKVFLGDVFGIWTKPATFWLENQKRFETEDSGVSPKPESGREYISVWYCINDYQAGGFVQSHTKGILEQISFLKAA